MEPDKFLCPLMSIQHPQMCNKNCVAYEEWSDGEYRKTYYWRCSALNSGTRILREVGYYSGNTE